MACGSQCNSGYGRAFLDIPLHPVEDICREDAAPLCWPELHNARRRQGEERGTMVLRDLCCDRDEAFHGISSSYQRRKTTQQKLRCDSCLTVVLVVCLAHGIGHLNFLFFRLRVKPNASSSQNSQAHSKPPPPSNA